MRQVFLIRLALILGVGTFAALTIFLRRDGSVPGGAATPAATLEMMRYAVWGLSAFAVAWAFFWKARVEAAPTEARVNSGLIVGWAPGEAVALFGTVQHFVGGPLATMAFGLLAFVVVLLILRVPTPPRS